MAWLPLAEELSDRREVACRMYTSSLIAFIRGNPFDLLILLTRITQGISGCFESEPSPLLLCVGPQVIICLPMPVHIRVSQAIISKKMALGRNPQCIPSRCAIEVQHSLSDHGWRALSGAYVPASGRRAVAMNRTMQVYKMLGQVPNSPQSFGLRRAAAEAVNRGAERNTQGPPRRTGRGESTVI